MTTSIRDADWNGSYIGNQQCNEYKIQWGIYRTFTYIDNVPIIRMMDPDGVAVIADEMSGFFGLMKTGTIRFKCRGYVYAGYSFMTGETQYQQDDYDMNIILQRWKTYYSWWNIQLKSEDVFVRKFYGRDVLVCYPSTGLRVTTLSNEYGLSQVDGMTEDLLRIWLKCYNNDDASNIINRARQILEIIVNRINPELISYVNVFARHLSKYLSFYLGKDHDI